MCGICGLFDLRAKRDFDAALLERLNETLRHRGPDAGGTHCEAGVALGHRRLSIIDLAGGRQPLFNEDGSVAVVFNGEIYNFQTLVPELEALGHVFRSRSDTEVIVHAWEAWGEACVTRFRGMFAFALWDRRRETLFLARDRLGVKPLYYATLPDGAFVFGSELKAIVRHPDFVPDIDPLAVEEYFALGYVPEPRSVFRGVRKLPPAHTLCLRRGEPSPEPHEYWDVDFSTVAATPFAEAMEELTRRLREAVRLRLVADVPLGAFLSGGVDSSAVVATMAALSPQPVNTCAIAFDEAGFNESEYARAVAERYRTRHFVETVKSDDFDLVDTLAGLFDEPFADSSAIPSYRVCQLARKHVTVALSGDGGDESLAGYRRYRLHVAEERLRAAMPAGARRLLFGALGRLFPKLDWAPRPLRAKTTLQALAKDSVAAYFHSVSIVRDDLRARLFSPQLRRELGGYGAIEVFRAHAARARSDDALALAQYLDFKTWLVGDINTKVDRVSMAHALEVRAPLLDHELIEWLASVPAAFKIRGNEGKYLFKKAMKPFLPPEVLYRPKMGFSVPLARWLRGPLRQRVRDAVMGERLAATGFFDPAVLRRLVEAHESGARDHAAPLWTLLMFDAFLRRLDGATP
ncbi:MAG: amidotransferase 1, exosortase A system-associated [Azoarcus sp.]|jgi:asparagine synthase (glutamine-hydrolysing)|nr:amidotransferase 1, exosortase A system-associated [Azoarcus sp.]